MTNDINSIKRLIGQVSTIENSYKIIQQATGESFNLFQILGMETAEVKTHSKFLAELLNPNGSHLQGDLFLKLFIDYLNGDGFLNENKIILSSASAKVEIEKYIGKRTEDDGGRIDILISDNQNNAICIENKIYAREQPKQMVRYSNFVKGYKNSHLFYLTLYGNDSNTGEGKVVHSISYKKHITEWLELCKKEAVNLPILRETTGQYINLIKKLTNQSTNKKMDKEIQEVILKNSEESKLIYNNYEKAFYNLSNKILEELDEKIKNMLKNYPDWERYYFQKAADVESRGLIFIKPKFLRPGRGSFGLEEFNPLCRYHNFNHKVFYGIFNWVKDYSFLDKIDPENSDRTFGGWINYEFPTSEDSVNFDFTKSMETYFPNLLYEKDRNSYVDSIFTSFESYFKNYQKNYLKNLSEKYILQLDENFKTNRINNLENVDQLNLYKYVKDNIHKSDFKGVTNMRIWSKNEKEKYKESCLVVDFQGGFRFDFKLINGNKLVIELIELDKIQFKDHILSKIKVYEYMEKIKRYRSKIEGDTIDNVIDNLRDKIKEISDIISK